MKQEVQAELEFVRKQHGGVLRAEDVVQFAKDPDTALHAQFTWDDTTAAEQFRLWQARELIRVCVTVIPHSDTKVRVYASLSTDRKAGGGYRKVEEVMKDRDMRTVLLEDAKRDMQLFIERYNRLKELSEVVRAMRRALLPTNGKAKNRKRARTMEVVR